jgi:hypothetical protein
MNGAPEFRAALIDLGFNKPRTVNVVRRIGDAGLTTKHRPGRRPRDAEPFTADDYATIILGFGALNPIHAPATTIVLGRLKRTSATLHRIIRDEAGQVVRIEVTPEPAEEIDLRDALSSVIEVYAKASSEDRNQVAKWARGRFIHLDAAGATASLVYQPERDVWLTEYFGPAKRNALMPEVKSPALLSEEIDIKIPYGVILLAAKLLAEAKAEQATLFSGEGPASSGQDTETAEPESKDAPDLPGSEASKLPPKQAALFTNQPLALAAGVLHNPETRETGKNYQSPTAARGWTLPQFNHGKSQQCPLLMA